LNYINTFITVGGIGSRLKSISLEEKYNLYYINKKIIDHIMCIVPEARIIGYEKTKNRLETLKQIPDCNRTNVLIIDCDIIPFGLNLKDIDVSTDCVYVFSSDKQKYSSVILDKNIVVSCDEKNNISNIKCSGVYFCKNLELTMQNMLDPNSIISGMNYPKAIFENSFKRFGDVDDYYEAIGL